MNPSDHRIRVIVSLMSLALLVTCRGRDSLQGDRSTDAGALVTDGLPSTRDASAPDTGADLVTTGCLLPEDCDDSDACTIDLCAEAGVCVHTPSSGACDDDDPCTTDDRCRDGVCVGTALVCEDDGDPCTEPLCVAGLGCTTFCVEGEGCEMTCQNDGDCDDGDEDSIDICVVGPCSSMCRRFWPRCDDANPCTEDRVDERGDCINVPLDGVACDDEDLCTQEDRCDEGRCVGLAVSCDDGNYCTEDYCEADRGCVSLTLPDGVPCDDADACTTDDFCLDGVCQGVPVSCPDDGDACSIEYCEPSAGCSVFCRVAGDCATECEHASDCPDRGVCAIPACVETACARHCEYRDNPCDDGEFCTLDTCDEAAGGCRHIVFCEQCSVAAECEDHDACTQDYCSADGFCEHLPVPCPTYGDPCAVATCDPVTACSYECIPDCGSPCRLDSDCDDGDACTTERCISGPCSPHCESTPRVCPMTGPCRGALCKVGACIDTPPAAAPTLDGVIAEDWHPDAVLATADQPSSWGASMLSELRVQYDDNVLYIGVTGLADADDHAIVGYLDVDYGANTGVHDLSALSGGSGPLDASVRGFAHFVVPGFGADFAFGTVSMSSAYGGAASAGWRRLSREGLRWLSIGAVVSDSDEHGVEAVIPLHVLLPDGVPESGATMALVVLLTSTASTCAYASPTLPPQNNPLTPETPYVLTATRFAIIPSLVPCCTTSDDCRDTDPCTRDVCPPGGICAHLDTGCIE